MPKLGSYVAIAVAAVVLASCAGGGDEASRPCAGPGTGGPSVVYRAEPTPDAPRVTRAGVEQTIEVMCRRARALGSNGARIRELSDGRIGVKLGPGPDASQTAVALGFPARLAFYNWDKVVIGNPDRPIADLLTAVRRAETSQPTPDASDIPPDGPEQRTVDRLHGDMAAIERFYDRKNDASGPSYYAESGGRIVAGPETSCAGLAMALDPNGRPPAGSSSAGDLDATACTQRLSGRGLPPGGTVHVVPRGTRVVAAARPGGGAPGGNPADLRAIPSERAAGYFVIEDDAGVLPDAVKGATERTDTATGRGEVVVKLTDGGMKQFRALTQGIAEYGLANPSGGDPRLAAALDDQLVSLVAIDPRADPGGISPVDGAVLTELGGAARAKLIAKLLDAGVLPLYVRPAP
jgi:hypothetical protein